MGLADRGLQTRPCSIALACLCAPLLLSLAACRKQDFPQYPADYREYAYVTNGGSGTLSIYDVIHVRLDREIPVGARPVAVAANPQRPEVYVVSQGVPGGNGSLAVVNATNNSIVASIALHREPVSLDVDATGSTAYVANTGSNTVSVIDLAAHRELAQIAVGQAPAAARISPDGKTLVVANHDSGTVSLISAATRQTRATLAGCPGAADVVILPDGSKAFVACSGGNQLMVIALARVPAPGLPARPDTLEAWLEVGQGPVHLALKPDGGEIFSSNAASDSFSEIYTTTDEVGGTYLIGTGPRRGLVSADNSLLYEANARSQDVAVYGIDDGKRVGSIHGGDGPTALAFSAAGHLLFAVDSRSGDVAVIRTSSRSLFTLLPAGRDPNAIAVKAFSVGPTGS